MKIRNLLMCAVAFCMSFVLSSCSEDIEINNIDFISNNANFVVVNKSTNESTNSSNAPLAVKNGDELELTYTPPQEYSKYSWKVDFEIDEIKTLSVSKSPYTSTYTVPNMEAGSKIMISCSAVIEQKDITFTGLDYNAIYIAVTE